ncbi:MAG: tRNA 2-selenouridine(34) synthase MnmH [Bdellovibrio sp.]
MSNSNIKVEELKNIFLKETPLIDVRAPVEFAQGSLPGAINLPILNNDERALIGTTYKQKGQEEAVRLGYQIISGSIKEERIHQWSQFILEHPEAVLYCFRGGKRSQITQQWLKENGIERPLIVGGYKAARQFLMQSIEDYSAQKQPFIVSGPTGSGKTTLLETVKDFYPSLDLEYLARHRGSAFGSLSEPQPSQVDFENRLAVNLLKLDSLNAELKHLRPLVEDESRLIGRVCLPDCFFNRMRDSEVIWLDEDLPTRVNNIFNDYILKTPILKSFEVESQREEALKIFDYYGKALVAISKKLGGLRTQELIADLEYSRLQFLNNNEIESNKVWIEKLLIYYYDPLYLKSLERRQVKVVFKGPKKEVMEFLKSLKA